jgi:uncharacterized protein
MTKKRRSKNWGGARKGAGRKTDKQKPAAEAKQQHRYRSAEDILEAVRLSQESARTRPRTPEWNPYIIRPELFGPVAKHIAQNRKALAMDSNTSLARDNQIAIQAWQAGGLLGNVVSEGLLFLGYPYLAELAQRPEFRLIAEIRAQEMTRKWTQFRGVDDESTKEADKPKDRNRDDEERDNGKPRSDARNKEIEAKIKELKDFEDELRVRDWCRDAAAQDGFMGISHLQVDIKGADLERLNDPELKKPIGNGRDGISQAKLSKGCLRSLRTIEAIWVYPTTYNANNPLSPSWYDPQQWYVMGTEIHKSRLLSFIGRPVPDILKPAYAFGGLSMTQMAQPYVDIWLKTRASIGEIIHAFSVMVLATDMGTTTQPGGLGLLGRLMEFNAYRDNQGVFAINKTTEDFKNVSAPISGLHELQAQAQEHMCSVARLPLVKFTGISPSGLNATSEFEMRAFNDTVHGEQEQLFRPNLNTIYDIMQISLWGKRDPDITYDFLPLQESTPKEKAEIRKIEAETDQIRIDSGVVSQEEVRTKLINDEESGFDGLDPEDVPDLLEEEEMGLEPQGGRPQPQAEIGAEREEGVV